MSMRRAQKIRITKWSILVGGAACLEIIARTGIIRRSTLTPVSEMFVTLWRFFLPGETTARLLKDSSIAGNFFMTFGEILLSFSFALLVGLPVGIFLWKFKTLARILNPYLVSYYAIPVFALYPFIVGVFGIGILSITFMGWLFAIVAVIINTATGFGEVDKRIYPKVGKSLRLSRSRIFLWIYFPAATPYIFTGLKLGFIYSIIGVIASEFILSTKGLGHLVRFCYSAFETEIMYASMLLIVIIAVLVNGALMRVESWLYGRQGR
jgi:NitT/TauT family transport system permease protein